MKKAADRNREVADLKGRRIPVINPKPHFNGVLIDPEVTGRVRLAGVPIPGRRDSG